MSKRAPIERLAFAFALGCALVGAASAATVGAADVDAPFTKAFGPGLHLLRITPAGVDVTPGSQIVLAFDRPVVPLGRMERKAEEIPVTVAPAVDCGWRWLDPQTLACQLPEERPLQPATRYTITVRPEFVTENGEKLARGTTHSFVTQRPVLQYAGVSSWAAPGVPVLRLHFSQPVTAPSVEASLDFDGRPAQARADVHDERTPYYVPGSGEARRMWLVQPQEELPADREVALRVKPGLVSALGTERSVERRVAARLHTFAPLEFLGIRCRLAGGEGKALLIAPGELPQQNCDPLSGASLSFSAPVPVAEIKRALKLTPDPFAGRKDDPWAELSDNLGLATDNRGGAVYEVHLPFTPKASAEYRVTGDAGLKDVFGRTLKERWQASFRTGHRAPALHLTHKVAVLEQGVESEVPAIVTNLPYLDADYARLTAGGAEHGHTRVPIASVPDLAYAVPLGVRQMLDGASGVVAGTLTAPLKLARDDEQDEGEDTGAEDKSGARHFFAEVTPWQVHVKLGHYDTLVWVSEFATGAPVAGAQVQIFPAKRGEWQAVSEPAGPDPAPAVARTDAEGLAALPGTATLDPKLERVGWNKPIPLAVRVVKGADLALLPLTDDFNVDVYRASHYVVSNWQRPRYGHLKSWGTTAQGVYRAGDTVQYKIYVRNDAARGLAPAPAGPYRLQVFDPADQEVYRRDAIQLSAFGACDGQFTVAKQGKVGWYRFALTPLYARTGEAGKETDESAQALEPLRVLVSDFTPAPFKLSTELRTKRAFAGDTVTAVLRAMLHAGGAYSNAPARLTARLEAGDFEAADPAYQAFQFDTHTDPARDRRNVLEREGRTDASGEFATGIALPESDIAWGRLTVEGSAQDDRGRSVAGSASIPYAGRDRLIGLRSRDWLLTQGRAAQVETVVVDAEGQAAAGSPYYLKVEWDEVKMARVKELGNAYIARYSDEWHTVQVCKGRSRAGVSVCEFTPPAGGSYRVTAMTRDTRDRLHTTVTWLWASGQNEFLWQTADDYGLELVPDRERYKVGDTARFLVKNPYPGAIALISAERYGVIWHRTQKLEGSAPVVEVPITPELLPGFYLSVVVQAPRVAAPPPQGDVDLGKPTFRMGYAKVTVDDPYKQLAVQVTPERTGYKPRERAAVTVEAASRTADAHEPVEFAVAVLDEAVYDLIRGGARYFDPHQGFNGYDELDLANYSLLTRLVGRQKFEKKGATPGGDGGVDLALRSIDKYLAYWNPALPADAQGRARFEFELPDNLTAWKVLALAVTPGDRQGLGQGRIVVTKDTELRPLLPNALSAGDRVRAGFSVLNRAAQTRTLQVQLKADGAAQGAHAESLTLKSFGRGSVYFDVQARQSGTIRFTATAGDAQDRDALALSVPVRPQKPIVTAADYGTLVAGGRAQIPIRLPPQAERGALAVSFAPSVLGNVDGAFEYLRDYPYWCWEQRLSKGAMAAYYLKLRPYLDPKLDWPEAEAVIAQIYADAPSFQAPSGGMAFWDADESHVSPYLSAYTALVFEQLRAAGYPPPVAVVDRLGVYLDRVLKRELPDYSLDASSAVRAAILDARALRGGLPSSELQRYAPQLPRMGLFGQALFLQAALHTDGAETLAERALDQILARGSESAGSLVLKETQDDFWSVLLGSPLRSNCAALSALADISGANLEANPALAELPFKLVRSVSQARGGRDHWDNTQENVYCMAALAAYARRYESAAPAATLHATLDGQPLGEAHLTDLRQPPVTLSHALGAADAGREEKLALQHEGQGRAYFAARLSYAENEAAAQAASAGLELTREYRVWRDNVWQKLSAPMKIRRGEKVRVALTLAAPAERHYVVVDDPLPGGLEPINPDLATASGVSAEQAEPSDSAYPYPFYHRELRFEAARFFADDLPAGRYTLYWIGEAVAAGEFAVPPPHAEEMYDPEVFGNDVPARLIVEDAPPAGDAQTPAQ